MNEWMDGWKDERMKGWKDEWMNERMKEWMNEWKEGWMNEWMRERYVGTSLRRVEFMIDKGVYTWNHPGDCN